MTHEQIPVDPDARVATETEDGLHEVLADLAYQRQMIVNVVFWGAPRSGRWVLIDAGVLGSTRPIVAAAERRFGGRATPAAIVLTHGHFDHVGAARELADHWDVPVYAHEIERPYLDGTASYPPADPSVGGGMMAALSRFYPRGPVDLGHRLRTLPADRSVPEMPGWRWIHVPGHTPGQVALWREDDRTLLAADAFITTRQESAYMVMTQHAELHGPPTYYTQDWDEARESVRRLASLDPETVVAGHGPALRGTAMREALRALARDFDEVAVPPEGRYVDRPATADDGTAYPSPH